MIASKKCSEHTSRNENVRLTFTQLMKFEAHPVAREKKTKVTWKYWSGKFRAVQVEDTGEEVMFHLP